MNRKLDLPALLLFAAFLFGVIVRFYPAVANGFPLNDGGMFYTMVEDLQANGYRIPQVTTYNHADIPFAYPPLGFYLTAILSDLLPVPALSIFLYLPAVFNTLTILAVYLLAKETTDSRITAALTAIIYAFSWRAFTWQVMGGGITRAPGVLFLVLMAWQAAKLFKGYRHNHLLLTILFGAGTVLSHPQTALHAAVIGFLIFLLWGRSKRGIASALLVGLGVAVLSAPWWLNLLLQHGLAPMASASVTSDRSLSFYLYILRGLSPLNLPAIPFLILMYVGIWVSIRERNFLYIAWAAFAYLADPRGADSIALVPETVLAAMGLIQLAGWLSREKGEPLERQMMMRGSLILTLGFLFWSLILSGITDFQLVNTSLKQPDLELMEWVRLNSGSEETFLIVTGREFSLGDPLQEWFPALTGRRSVTTIQGLEWTLAEGFFTWFDQLAELQRCEDVTCVQTWAESNRIEYDYLIVLSPEDDGLNAVERLDQLSASARSSDEFSLFHELDYALIFKRK